MGNPYEGTALGAILAAGQDAAGTGSGSASSVTADPYGLGADGGIPIYMGGDPVKRTIPGQSNDKDNRGKGRTKGSYVDQVPTTTTAANIAATFATLLATNPAQYYSLQQTLYAAGYYGSSKPGTGYTGKDQNALNEAMRSYYAYTTAIQAAGGIPEPFAKFLAMGGGPDGQGGNSDGSGGGGGGGSARAPLQVQLTDPGQLKATLNAAAQEALGRDLDQGQIDAFVKAYQAKEREAQTNAYNGATTITPPDAQSMAMDMVETGNPEEAKNQSDGQYVRAFASMMGASF